MSSESSRDATLRLLPNGHLVLTGDAGLPRGLGKTLAASLPDGLLALATEHLEESFAADLSYWRGLAHDFLTRLCQSPASASWSDVAPPDAEEMAAFLAKAPPVPGMEYLTPGVVLDLWAQLNAAAARAAAETEGGLDAWLKARHPLWRLVGRVSFHLAENKRNEQYPFAFLATYTHRISNQARLQYLPLGKALKEYAGKKNTRALQSLLAPVQAAAEACGFARELLETRRVFHALAWSPAEAHAMIRAIPELEKAGLIVKVPDWWEGGHPPRATVAVTLDAAPKTTVGMEALLSFRVEIALGDQKLTDEEWEKILNSSGNLVSLKGQWIEVDREKLTQMLEHWRRAQSAAASGHFTFLQGMRLLAGFPLGGAGLDALEGAPEGGGDWTSVTAGGRLKELLAQLRDPSRAPEITSGKDLRATLRPYQQVGLRWLALMHGLGLGACLADDMGLGKTLQVIALLAHLRKGKAKSAPPSLLVVPASLVGNWRAEFERFAPSLRVFYAHPSQTPRETLADLAAEISGCDAVVTTYSMLGRLKGLTKQQWNLAILDEAQAIKNPRAGQTKNVKLLQARTRVALTGTPVENSVADLWSLFDFLNPGLLGTSSRFSEAIKSFQHKTGADYSPLRRLTGPYILRRLKTDRSIITDLPDKTEVRAHCPLTKGQAALYEKSVRQLRTELDAPEMDDLQRNGLVLSYLMRFKQICDHPALWTGSGNFGPDDSGKFQRLRELCSEIHARGEKVLVFTQFREMTGPLADFLDEHVFHRPGLVLHGGTPVKRRQKLVTDFQADTGPPFFVISLKAGGTGLNLTAASHVIHFDRWWNPAVENQATDRAFRIGQKRNVLVQKFVCPGTIEEKIDRLISEKQELADALLDAGAEKALTQMSNDELLAFVALDLDAAVF